MPTAVTPHLEIAYEDAGPADGPVAAAARLAGRAAHLERRRQAAERRRPSHHHPRPAGLRADPKGFARIMWVNWAPEGWFEEAEFAATAKAFENPDWVAVTLHSYRARWDEAKPDPRSRRLEAKVKATKTLSLPTLYIGGAVDGVNPPSASKTVPEKFTGPFRYIELPGVGHFPTREAPDAVADLLIQHFTV